MAEANPTLVAASGPGANAALAYTPVKRDYILVSWEETLALKVFQVQNHTTLLKGKQFSSS